MTRLKLIVPLPINLTHMPSDGRRAAPGPAFVWRVGNAERPLPVLQQPCMKYFEMNQSGIEFFPVVALPVFHHHHLIYSR